MGLCSDKFYKQKCDYLRDKIWSTSKAVRNWLLTKILKWNALALCNEILVNDINPEVVKIYKILKLNFGV